MTAAGTLLPRRDHPSRLRAGLGALVVGASVALLHALGTASPAPPVLDPPGLVGWLNEHDPAFATISILRLVGLGGGWYLIGTTTLQLLARRSRVRGLVAAADAVTLPAVRHTAAALLGVTMTAAFGAEHGHAAPAPVLLERVDEPAVATMQRLPGDDVHVRSDDEGVAVLERLPEADPTPTEDAPPLPELDDVPRAEPAPTETVRARFGDHLWSLSEERLADEWGRAPSDLEVDGYWRDVVAANGLPDPDLLLPGQAVTLPPPPPAP